MCPRHPDVAAVASCRRCGAFVCAQDSVQVEASVFCPECAARPDVDYLEAFRLKFWGKRDSWAWFFGIGGAFNLLTGLALVVGALLNNQLAAVPVGVVVVALGVSGVLFWFGLPLARWLLLGGVALLGVAQAVTLGPAGMLSIVIPLLVVGSAIFNTRNKLFFKRDVTRAELKKSWDILHNNTIARSSTTLGIGGLLIGFFAPLAIITGVIGLRRVDPTAHPPIGNKGYAIAGIVLGAIGTLLWGGITLAIILGK